MIEFLCKFIKNKIPWSQLITTVIVCIPNLVNGLQLAWPSPSIPILISADSPIALTFEETSYFGVIPFIASIACSPIFAKIVDNVGRKYTILQMALPQLLAWLLIRFAKSLATLYCARALIGVSEAGVLISVPMYIGEIVEPKIRGKLGSLPAFSLYLGQFLMNVIGSYNSIETTALICCVFPIVFFICFLFCPESPYYLLMKNRARQAEDSLKRLRNNFEQVELDTIKSDVQRQMSETKSIKDLFVVPSNRKALLIAVGVRSAHQLSGISAFTVYTQYIFEKSGTVLPSSTAAIMFSGLQAIIVVFSSLVVDKVGRRPLLLFSSFGCTSLLTILTIYFYFVEYTNFDISFFSWVPLAVLMLFIVTFSIGFGIVPVLLLGEIFSVTMKGKALSFMNIYYALCFIITSKVLQLMISNIGMFCGFCFFAVGSFISNLFCYYYVPETKGKSLEDIQQYFKSVT